jgi:hypothetical protein
MVLSDIVNIELNLDFFPFTKIISFISQKDVKCSSLTKVNVLKLIKVSGKAFFKILNQESQINTGFHADPDQKHCP